jgi:hypothetical protein
MEWFYVIAMLDLTGHMIIWGGLFTHGDGSTGLMKVVFCYALPTVVQGLPCRLDMSRSSLGVILRGLPARGRSVAFPV